MADQGNEVIVGSPVETARSEHHRAEFWTEERRNAATPIPFPREAEKPKLEIPKPRGEAGHVAHGLGSETDAPAAISPRSTGGQAVASPLNYPYRTVGKLFFTQGSGSFSGSAALVAPNVLLTAGHCVHNNGVWSTNMTFFPSYGKRAANDPAYKFACGRLACRTSWLNNSDRAHDYGMAWIGAAPGNIVGWLGLLWNAPTAGRTWDAVGYPATPNPPFNGQTMDEAVGTVVQSSTSGTIGLSNDNMEHGSSGGPWITNWNGNARDHANGVQSFHIHDGDLVEYGPYFTDEVKALFDWISNPANH